MSTTTRMYWISTYCTRSVYSSSHSIARFPACTVTAAVVVSALFVTWVSGPSPFFAEETSSVVEKCWKDEQDIGFDTNLKC